MKRTNIYVDGFNLYYGALKNTPYKWLNLLEFCQRLLPKNNIHQIKYFSAKVSARPQDPDQPVRQQTFWRALKTLPNLSIIEGSFLSHPVKMPLAESTKGKRVNPVWVMKTEEKGSDVNLATHLINDAHNKDFDIAVMITNDSDLLEPMRIVREELGLPVGIINPQQKPSFQLQSKASFIKSVRPWVLKSSQFPETLTDTDGLFSKPKAW
ncbi:MAG TPA: NYN domain-containing protein [Pirellulaceae bacterium]|nr:NYN domain-containing protein [Pyrinomonadaceae bacterium]HMP65571.1 NYN domain-containing protein [Pyrinomonadaceae bacterium]HMP70723.1 NYN domain-containing protein [Pirellulaceae bacterium]